MQIQCCSFRLFDLTFGFVCISFGVVHSLRGIQAFCKYTFADYAAVNAKIRRECIIFHN